MPSGCGALPAPSVGEGRGADLRHAVATAAPALMRRAPPSPTEGEGVRPIAEGGSIFPFSREACGNVQTRDACWRMHMAALRRELLPRPA